MKKYLIIFLLFLFAVSLRLWNLGTIGRTWDEGAYVRPGVRFVQLFEKKDFNNKFWYDNPDHPPLARYLFGLASFHDVQSMGKDSLPELKNNDFVYAKLVSVIFSCFTIVLMTLFGWEYISPFVGISSGVILAMLPFYVGFSQLATLESLIAFFFTAATYSFFKLLSKKFSLKYIFLTGILSGLALLVKQSNMLLFPLFAGLYGLWFFKSKQKEYKKFINRKLLSIILIPIIAGVTFVALWPMPFLHLKEVIAFHNHMWVDNVNLPPPEVFFGKLHLVPKYYYVVMFFITTPLLILFLFGFGCLKVLKQKSWIYLGILLWFAFPFVQSLYPFKQHGIRYIIEIYAPLTLLAGIGLQSFIEKFSKKNKTKYFILFLVIVYLFIALQRITPYYIDYFNELAGGTKGVYDQRSFQLGWWGEGTKEAVDWIGNHARKGSSVGIIFNQIGEVSRPENLKIEVYDDKNQFDYVVLNYFSVLREGFNDKKILKDYKKVYSVMADRAPIVSVYKRIKN